MFDLDIIRDNYASMPDEKLILLAKEEKQELTAEALALLKEEFSKRCLSMDVFATTVEMQPAAEQREPVEGSFNPVSTMDDAILGLSYQDMMYPPDKEKELNENKEAFMAKLGEEDINILIKKCDASMTKNVVIFTIGLAVTLLTFMAAEGGGTYVVAWGAILFGGINFFRAFGTKNKLKSALKDMNTPQE
jgi:hypothetical protein